MFLIAHEVDLANWNLIYKFKFFFLLLFAAYVTAENRATTDEKFMSMFKDFVVLLFPLPTLGAKEQKSNIQLLKNGVDGAQSSEPLEPAEESENFTSGKVGKGCLPSVGTNAIVTGFE